MTDSIETGYDALHGQCLQGINNENGPYRAATTYLAGRMCEYHVETKTTHV
jgi:hypothetical protein